LFGTARAKNHWQSQMIFRGKSYALTAGDSEVTKKARRPARAWRAFFYVAGGVKIIALA
jgi:hypothetical protein